jgi:predicted nucleic acid-binding protein
MIWRTGSAVRSIVLDTSALFAMASRGETRHQQSRDAFEGLTRAGSRFVTTELVLEELHAVALSRVGPEHAAGLVERLGASARILVVPADAGLSLLRTRPGRRYSLADATSFVVMREMGIDTAFTLDADFAAEGFTVLPAP